MTEPLGFRLITRADFGQISTWLAEPAVYRWWHDDPAPAAVEAYFGPCLDGTDPTEVFVIELDGRGLGLIQRFLIADYPPYVAELAALVDLPPGALSIDYFIGSADFRGRGLGARLIAEFLARSWVDWPSAPAMIVPVAAANSASRRSLERAGFALVTTGPLTPDNPADGPEHAIYRVDRVRPVSSG